MDPPQKGDRLLNQARVLDFGVYTDVLCINTEYVSWSKSYILFLFHSKYLSYFGTEFSILD